MKEALTNYNGIGSIKYIIDDNLKNDEYTSKQIKKNIRKNKPILMVEERYLPKQSKKDKIKSFFKNHTVGLFKGKSNVIKEIVENKEQKGEMGDLGKKQKEKSKMELKKKLEELPKKQDFDLKANKIKEQERMTPPLLRDSDTESESKSYFDSDSDIKSDPYQVY